MRHAEHPGKNNTSLAGLNQNLLFFWSTLYKAEFWAVDDLDKGMNRVIRERERERERDREREKEASLISIQGCVLLRVRQSIRLSLHASHGQFVGQEGGGREEEGK